MLKSSEILHSNTRFVLESYKLGVIFVGRRWDLQSLKKKEKKDGFTWGPDYKCNDT